MSRHASAYGLSVNPDQHWSHHAACARPDVNRDLFHVQPATPNWHAVGEAIHICRRHCPVRQQCHEELAGLRASVVGGRYYNDKGKKSAYQPMGGFCGKCQEELVA